MVVDPVLPDDELRHVAANVLSAPVERAGPVSAEHIHGMETPVASGTAGIWRVRGELPRPWSAVLKLVHHSDHGHEMWRTGEGEDHWYYWRREELAYTTGLLDRLAGGLRAPRCHGAFERPDGSVALWIEDAPGIPGHDWSLDRYRLAARHLGEAQGAHLVAGAPGDAWLSRGWLRAYVERRAPLMAALEDERAWSNPVVASRLPRTLVGHHHQLWADRDLFLTQVEGLPRVLSHFDVHPANLFGDDESTVLVDWSFVGLGAPGEDAGNFVADSVLDFHVAATRIQDLDRLVFDGYLEGLAAAGWSGPPEEIRLAFTAGTAIKYLWILPRTLWAVSTHQELLNRRPLDEALESWGVAIEYLRDLAGEARALLRARS